MKRKEEEYWRSNPSPLKGVVIWCKTPFCNLVMDYHGTEWRAKTKEDHDNYRKLGGFTWYCPKHNAQAHAEKEEADD